MIEQVSEDRLPIFAKYSIVEIGSINIALDSLLLAKGFSYIPSSIDGLGESKAFLFKLDRDYYFLHVLTDHPTLKFTQIHTTSLRRPEQSFQVLFDALNISLNQVGIYYDNFDIQYVSIQNQLNLR
ncbi:hypothetical protein [Acinetobacter sp. Marseille-Q1623]|uniref:hypothetical protein n=1 Tax=Acinetobacter sp. Marseille-Q1623 TaxID=2697501 RepID=UPI00157AADE6|nr:hypothetical protein [Acinetobacter sp. Marseille-Q1623]